MFHICASCGSWVERWETSVSESTIRCPECRGTHRFRFLPLLVLLGASGTGKTTVAWAFAGRRMPWVTLEQDILWRAELDEPEGGYRRYRETWLRLAANVHQSGYPVLLAGTGTPDQFEGCEERRMFLSTSYAATVCDEEALRDRLTKRPAWRLRGAPDFVEEMVEHNAWLRRNARTTDPPVTLFDTTGVDPSVTAGHVERWARQELSAIAHRGL